MMRKNIWIAIPCLLVFFGVVSAVAAPNLPQKAFKVDGGTVSLTAGVMPDPATPVGLFGNMRYPTRYFIYITNESPYPLWLDTTWTFPEKKKGKAGKPRTIQGKKLPPQGSYWYYFNRFSVIADQAIAVEIRAYADEKRTNMVGNQNAELFFDQSSVDTFLASFPKLFQSEAADAKHVFVLSGWHDIPHPRTDVPGTLGDEVLQTDIQLSVWKADSVHRWTCEREVLSAELVTLDESQIMARLPADAQAKARLEQADNKLVIEKWAVRSCGGELSYEILLSISPTGGTDVMVMDAAGLVSLEPVTFDSGANGSEAASTAPLALPETGGEEALEPIQPVDESS